MIRAINRVICGVLAASSTYAVPALAQPASQQENVVADVLGGDIDAIERQLPLIAAPILASLARIRIAAAHLDAEATFEALDAYLSTGDADGPRRALAWATAGQAAFAVGDYRRAADMARRWIDALDGTNGDRVEAQNVLSVASALAAAPKQEVVARRAAVTSTLKDAAGLTRAPILVNGHRIAAILDTGANLSTISASAAQQLGIRMLGTTGSVGSATRAAVRTRFGVADRLEIAGVTLENVAFLVVDDEQLKVPIPNYRLDLIVGFPVFRALGRVTFGRDRTFSVGARSLTGSLARHNLHFSGNSPTVMARLNGIAVPLHLDTGAPASSLTARFGRLHPAILSDLDKDKVRSASAGGTIEQHVLIWRDVSVEIAGAEARLPQIPIVDQQSANIQDRWFGVLGQDILQSFPAYTIDFAAVSFEAGEQAPDRR